MFSLSKIKDRIPERLKEVGRMLSATWDEYQRDGADLLGAAAAFYTLLSFAPLFVFLVLSMGLFFDKAAVQDLIFQRLSLVIGSSGADAVAEFAAGISDRRDVGFGVITLIAIVYGATRLFAQLQTAMNRVWNVRAVPPSNLRKLVISLARKRLMSFLMVLGLGALLAATVLLDTVLNAVFALLPDLLPRRWIWMVGNAVATLGLGTLVFAAVFKVLPDVKVQWRHVWVGAAFTSVLFLVGKLAISWYLGNRGIRLADGATGSVLVILFWAHYTSQAFFFGAEFTEVYAHRYGGGIEPNEFAERDRGTAAPPSLEGMPSRRGGAK